MSFKRSAQNSVQAIRGALVLVAEGRGEGRQHAGLTRNHKASPLGIPAYCSWASPKWLEMSSAYILSHLWKPRSKLVAAA